MIHAIENWLHRTGAALLPFERNHTSEDLEQAVEFEANKLAAYRQAGELRRSAIALLIKSAELKMEVRRGRQQRA